MTQVALHTVGAADTAPSDPVAKPTPVDRDEYTAATCPLCFGSLWERIHGLFCPRCRGWLVAELREGRLVHSLWQGKP